jgi:hypothetical protein
VRGKAITEQDKARRISRIRYPDARKESHKVLDRRGRALEQMKLIKVANLGA